MKSLLAVLALAIALGGGYWKLQNPQGGLEELKVQAMGTSDRLKVGFDAIKTGVAPATLAATTGGVATGLAVTSSNAQSNTLSKGGSAAAQQQDIDSISDRLQQLETGVDNLSSAAKNAEEGIGPLEDRLTELEAHAGDASDDGETNRAVVAINERLDALEAAPVAASSSNDTTAAPANPEALASISAIETRLKLFETSLNSVQSDAADQSAQQAQQESISQLSDRLADLDARVATLNANTSNDEMVSTVTSLSTRFDAMENKLTQVESTAQPDNLVQLENMEKRFDSIEDKVNSVAAGNGDAEAAATVTANMNWRLNQLETALDTLQTSEEESSANTGLTQRIDGLESSIATLVTENSKLSEKVFNEEPPLMAAKATEIKSLTEDLDQQNSELSGQIASLEKRVEQMGEELSQKSVASSASNNGTPSGINPTVLENMAVLTTQAGGLETRINSLEAKITDIDAAEPTNESSADAGSEADEERLTRLETSIASFDEKMQKMTKRLEAASSQPNSESNGMPSVDLARMATLESSFADFNEKLALLDSRVEQINKPPVPVSAQVPTDAAQVEKLESSIASLDEKLALLDGRIDQINESPVPASTKVPTDTAQVAKLESSIATLDEKLALLDSRIEQINDSTEPASIETSQNRLQDQLANLEGKVNGAPSPADLQAMNKALELSRERIQQLESRVSNLPGSSDEADAAQKAQDDLIAQIAELETRLAEEARKPNKALVSTLTQVQKKVSALESRPYISPEELAKRQQGNSKEYKIYFGKNSTEIGNDAAKVLQSFIAQEQNRTTGVTIYGFTDRTGDANYNQRLALRRANNVRSFLIQSGFDFKKINAVDGIGEDVAAAYASDGKEDANQRSVVLYAYQP